MIYTFLNKILTLFPGNSMVIAHVLRSAHEVTVAPIRAISEEQEDKKEDKGAAATK